MAAPLSSKLFFKFLGINTKISDAALGSVRHASKKAGGSTRNPKGPVKGKHREPKVFIDEKVHKGEILVRQIGLKSYPGENVGLARDQTLIALKDGKVVASVEELSPYPHSPLYPAVSAGRVLYKKFYHVIPEPRKGRFRLVSQT